MCKTAVNPRFLGALRLVSFLNGALLLTVGILGFRSGVLDLHDESTGRQGGIQLWLLSCYCIIASFLMMLGEVRWPKVLMTQCLFLDSFLGRAIVQILVGASVLIIGPHLMLCIIAGTLSSIVGVTQLIFSLPFFTVKASGKRNTRGKQDEAADEQEQQALLGSGRPDDYSKFNEDDDQDDVDDEDEKEDEEDPHRSCYDKTPGDENPTNPFN